MPRATLVDASSEEAYLLQDGIVVAHRFADGAERPVSAFLGFASLVLGLRPYDHNLAVGLAATVGLGEAAGGACYA